MPRNPGGFYGSYEGYDRDFGAGGNLGRYDVGYRNEYGGGYRGGTGRWGGYADEGVGAPYNGFGGRERMGGASRYEYDRDMGDQIREGWQDLKRGVRRAFGGGYDTGWRGEGRWGSEGGMGRGGYEGGRWGGEGGRFGHESGYGNRGYQTGRGWSGEGRWGSERGPGRGGYEGGGRGWGGGWSGEGTGRGWRGGQESGYGQGNRGFLGDRFETRGYGGDYQW